MSKNRAEASRRNGAKSRDPKTAAGKVRSARNALKHGLCAKKLVVLPEDGAEFRALEAALLAELAPVGALQAVLAQRVVSAAWRLMRADRIEAEVLDFRRYQDSDLGVALMRDDNGTPERRHRAALPRRRAGRVHARAQDPAGAPGGGPRRRRSARGATRKAARPPVARRAKRTHQSPPDQGAEPRAHDCTARSQTRRAGAAADRRARDDRNPAKRAQAAPSAGATSRAAQRS